MVVAYFAFGKKAEKLSEQNENINAPLVNVQNQNLPTTDQNINSPTIDTNVNQRATVTPSDTVVTKGWLEGTIYPLKLVLAEVNPSFSGYTGNKFALVFSKNSLCTLSETESSFFCVNLSEKWLGVGDRVRVYGLVKDDKISVSKLEVVSSLPLNQW